MEEVILIIGAIGSIFGLKLALKMRKERKKKHPYVSSYVENYLRTQSFTRGYEQIKSISNYQKTKLARELLEGRLDFPEYYQQYDDLIQWEREQWEKLYAK
jgi:hypothetical protein